MKRLIFGFVIGLGLGSFARAEDPVKANSEERFFAEGGSVHLMLASGDYTVRAGANDQVRVHWEPETRMQKKDMKGIKVRIGVSGDVATVRTEGPLKHARFVIEVPARSDLFLRMGGGDVRISGVEGNKDIHMTAGDLKIDVLPNAYSHVHASVTFGDLTARPLGISKDGIKNSLNWNGTGRYTLHASMFAGDLTLAPVK